MPSGVHVHKLSNLNEDELTADCANCGEGVSIRMKAGKPRCRIAIRGEKRRENNKHTKGPHGLTREQADAFKLGAVCAICGSAESLNVDHCHTSGRIRGVLCRSCNLGLGHFRDSPDLLRQAVEYLALKDIEISC